MPKVALLIGVTGSGKSWVASQLPDIIQVLKVDHIRSKAVRELTRDWREKVQFDRWTPWNRILTESSEEAVRAMANSMPAFDVRHVLADGEMLAHPGFRDAFLRAMALNGFVLEDVRVFWIQPPATVLKENVLLRGRENQRSYTLDDARASLNWYQREISKSFPPPGCPQPYLCSAEVVPELSKYFELTVDR